MIDFNKLPRTIQHDLTERGVSRAVPHMQPALVLDEYLAWNGIIGWGRTIYSAVHAIDKVDDQNASRNALDCCATQLALVADLLECLPGQSWEDVRAACRKQASVARRALEQ